ncbi:MAG: C39 family peptidase [Coriobacteriales bacterium]|jgi:uncharacterized protein YvpB|nr:C39 family peptidase [Coriobacteriales bacterium]
MGSIGRGNGLDIKKICVSLAAVSMMLLLCSCAVVENTVGAEARAAEAEPVTVIIQTPAKPPEPVIALEPVLVAPETVSALPDAFILDVPYLNQHQQGMQNGCESVTAVMALNYAGVDITAKRFVEEFLPKGNVPYYNEQGIMVVTNPWKAFPGNPRSEDSWYIFAPPLAEAMKQLAPNTHYVQGLSLDELCTRYVEKGYPVAVWTTVDWEDPYTMLTLQDEADPATEVVLISNEHCVLLVGFDSKSYYFNDPLYSKCYRVSRDQALIPYELMGSQALVIAPTQEAL